MNTSMIQDLPKVDSSRLSSSTRSMTGRSEPEDFKKFFESELSYGTKPRPGLKSSEDLTTEAQSSLSLPIVDPGAKSETHSVASKDSGNQHEGGDALTAGKRTTNAIQSDVASETEDAAPGKKDAVTEKGTTLKGEGKEGGKNVSPDQGETDGEAKTAARPSLAAGEKLGYGNVRKAENAVIGAGSAASSSIQAVNVHHGTSHASSVSRPDNGSPNEGSDRSGTMASNVMKNETSTNATTENDARKIDFLAGMKPVSGSGSSSSNTSFSGSQFEDGGSFSGKDTGGLTEVQIANKPQFVVPASTSQMVDSIRKMQSMIQDQVMVLKNINHQSMQVMIRPDANLSLFLTLHQGESEVLVAARMDGQTAGILKPHWAELQKELEQHGVKLGDPEAQYQEQSTGQQWNQSRGESDDDYGSQAFFLSPNEPSKGSLGNKESIHVLDPDFENSQGTLVSWA